MIKKVVTAHTGARDNYQLSSAFSEVGLLQTLITDLYFKDSNLFFGLFNTIRTNSQIDLREVNSNLILGLDILKKRVLKGSNHSRTVDSFLSNKALTTAIKFDSNLFLYSYYAYEAFFKSNILGFNGMKILFQLHPHPTSIRNILGDELERYPFCSQSINSELEFQLSDNDIFKLVSESKMADYIFVASSFTKSTLVENSVDPSKIFVTPYGVDHSKFPYVKKGKKNKTFNILFLGQMVQRKGLADLLCAVEILKSINIKVFICGRGYVDKGLLSNYSHLNLDIRYNISHLELLNLVKDIDLFVLPSLVEGFGHVILEAMSMGMVPVTSLNTCGPDIIQNGIDGFVISPKDPYGLANLIEKNIENRFDLEEIGHLASKKAQEFSWEKFRKLVILNYLSLYENQSFI